MGILNGEYAPVTWVTTLLNLSYRALSPITITTITITYRCVPESSQRGHRDAAGGEQWRSSRQDQQEEEMHRSYMQEQGQLEWRHRQDQASQEQRQSQELTEEERRQLQEREELEKRHRQERDWLERNNRGDWREYLHI